jgi:hypothetical protein
LDIRAIISSGLRAFIKIDAEAAQSGDQAGRSTLDLTALICVFDA